MATREQLLTKWADSLEALRAEMAKEANGETVYIATKIGHGLTRERNFALALMGKSSNGAASTHDIHQPVATVMGQPVIHRQPVKIEDTTPTNIERENYLRDVEETLTNFDNLTDDQIFSKCKLPGGEIVIRGIAKKLELPHYSSGEINTLFVKAIRDKIAHNAEQEKKLKDAEAAISGSTEDSATEEAKEVVAEAASFPIVDTSTPAPTPAHTPQPKRNKR